MAQLNATADDRPRWRIGLVALALAMTAATVLALATAPRAVATIVYDGGEDIWAMNDDGSGAKVVIPKESAPEMVMPDDSLGSPSVAAAGTDIAFTGTTRRFNSSRWGLCGFFPHTYSCVTFHSGQFATGIYRWAPGTSPQRLTAPPSPCNDCSSHISSPSLSADGSALLSSIDSCSGTRHEGTYDCSGSIGFREGGSPPPICGDGFLQGAVDPANKARFAYVGCSHPDSADFSAVVVAGGGPNRAVACDHTPQSAVAWSQDGSRLAVAEDGEDPGIWTYPAAGDACNGGEAIHALSVPADTMLEGLAYTGSGTIVFGAAGDLWSIPASCSGCSFPGSAKRLTSNASSISPSWSARPLGEFATAAVPGPSPQPPPPAAPRRRGAGAGDSTPLQRRVAKRCGRIKQRRQRKLCVKRTRAIARCQAIKPRSKPAKRRKAACLRKAKRIGKPKRAAGRKPAARR